MYVALGLTSLFTRLGQGCFLSYSSEKLTGRTRDYFFRSTVRQDIEFFDQKRHSTGTLTAFLSTSTIRLNVLSGAIFGSIASFMATIFGGLILSLIVGWKLALVYAATIPIVVACGWIRLKSLGVLHDKIKATQEQSAQYASQVVSTIRTVASLGLERRMLFHYTEILDIQARKSLQPILWASALYAVSQSCVFLCAALGFWYGGTLVAMHEYTVTQLFICFATLISGSQAAGVIFSFAPDISQAAHAGRELRTYLDTKPKITDRETSTTVDHKVASDMIEFDNVSFSYPLRPDRMILNGLSFSIPEGKFIAFVGPTGCGKSTILSLIERFYDPVSGVIRVDGFDISDLLLHEHRGLLSIVSQDSILYQGTIMENLTIGLRDAVSEDRVIQSCKEANIYDFITSLP
jgi:ATP-binding cassette subfamily B (MDR/TAP) protein 1